MFFKFLSIRTKILVRNQSTLCSFQPYLCTHVPGSQRLIIEVSGRFQGPSVVSQKPKARYRDIPSRIFSLLPHFLLEFSPDFSPLPADDRQSNLINSIFLARRDLLAACIARSTTKLHFSIIISDFSIKKNRWTSVPCYYNAVHVDL